MESFGDKAPGPHNRFPFLTGDVESGSSAEIMK